MRNFLSLFLFLVGSVALADAPVIWSGNTVQWLPSAMQTAGMCITDSSGVQTTLAPGASGNVPVSNGSQWTSAAGNALYWLLGGNSGTTPGTHYIGTSDAQDFQIRANNGLQITFDKDGGWYSQQTSTPISNDNFSQYNLQTQFTPAGNITNAYLTGLGSTAIYDQGNTGVDNTGGVSGTKSRFEHQGSGTLGFGSIFDGSAIMPNGGEIDLFKGINLDTSFSSGTLNGYYALSLTQNMGAVTFTTQPQFLNLGSVFTGSTLNQGLNGVDVSPSFQTGTTIGNNITGINTLPTLANDSALTGSITGISGNVAVEDTATVSVNAVGASFTSTARDSAAVTGSLVGFTSSTQLQDSATTAGAIGGNVSVSTSTPTGYAYGLQVNMGSASITQAALDSGEYVKGLSVSDGAFVSNYNYTIPAALSFFQTNVLSGSDIVASGAPISSYGFGTNLGKQMVFNDDFSIDGSGIGYNSVGFVGQIIGATGKTMARWTGALSGASNPSGAGTLTDAIMMRAGGILPAGGTLTITNLYGFQVDPNLFCLLGTNCWGFYEDGASVENHLSKLAIGTSTKKVANSSTALEIGNTKAFLNGRGTTAQKNALTAAAGMQFYDTDLNKLQWYNGSSWVSAEGSAPSLTAGSVVFSDGSTLAQDNANFFWDDTNNRLAVGHNVPSYLLDLHAASAVETVLSLDPTTGSDVDFRFENSLFRIDSGAYTILSHGSGNMNLNGTETPMWNVQHNSAATQTTLANYFTRDQGYPVMAIKNSSTTANNASGLAFVGNSNVSTEASSGILGVHESHTGGSETGHLEFWTRNAGTLAKRLDIAKDGAVTMDAYGAGVAHFDANGVVSSSAVDIASSDVTGTLPVANGGTGQTSYTDGQLLIGNSTGNTLTKSALTAGAGITITNGGGSITISSAGGSSALSVVSTNADYIISNSDDVILVTGPSTTGSIYVELPLVSSATTKSYKVKNLNTSASVIIRRKDTGSDVFDRTPGETTVELPPGGLPSSGAEFIPDTGGSSWSIF